MFAVDLCRHTFYFVPAAKAMRSSSIPPALQPVVNKLVPFGALIDTLVFKHGLTPAGTRRWQSVR